jgi:hypothetical protein
MSLHRLAPPAVQLVGGRPPALAWALVGLAVASAGVVAYWGAVVGQGWRPALAAGVWLLGCTWAARAWHALGQGVWSWDGECWRGAGAGGPLEAGELFCHLDAQDWMLLRWQPTRGRARWLAAMRQDQAPVWHGVRCALHARPSARPLTSPGVAAGLR